MDMGSRLRIYGDQIPRQARWQTDLWLGEKGFDPLFGARPLARVIQTELKDKIADAILFGPLAKGGDVKVDLGDDALTFEYQPR